MLAAHSKFHKDSIDRILGAHELVKRCTVPTVIGPGRLKSNLPAHFIMTSGIESFQRQQNSERLQ